MSKNLEIERKFLVKKENLPNDLKQYKYVEIEQGFISLKPCIRIRKSNDDYYLTIKTKSPKKYNRYDDLVRGEYEFDISRSAYKKLYKKCDGIILKKTRYFIPYKKHILELDIFKNEYKGLIYCECEFESVKEANNFIPPDWVDREVTNIEKYNNTSLSKKFMKLQ